jgi:lipopolysaccharide biosynthesis glycosyltransferase
MSNVVPIDIFPTKSRQEPLVLVFGSDDNYSMLLAVALHSALVHLKIGNPFRIYIIDGGIVEVNRQRLSRIVGENDIDAGLEWVTPDMELIGHLKTSGHITTAAYLPLLIPDLLPDRFDKAIYLDCDIQVETNLWQLWHQDIGEHALLAVRDYLVPYVSSPGGVTKHAALGLAPEMPYLNSGVLVLNLRRWRSEGINRKIFRYLHDYRKDVRFWDQDGLNAVLAGDWGMLNPKWNVQSSILSHERWPESDFKEEIRAVRDDLLHNAYIHHFIGPTKPNHPTSEHPVKARWHRYLGESGWFSPIKGTRGDLVRGRTVAKTPLVAKRNVTIAIPTYNRSQLLKLCLESVLAQDYSDFQVVVLDDASSDDTKIVVESLNDPRVNYLRNEINIGLIGNWNHALEVGPGTYLTILPDDDVILPGFIQDSVASLDRHPQAGFSTGLVRYIDLDGRTLRLQDVGDVPTGIITGLDFLHRLVSGLEWTIHTATVMIRSSALAKVEPFKVLHSKQLFDLNFYIRLLAHSDMFFMRKEIAHVRLHTDQGKEREFHALDGTKPLALVAELMDALAHLLQSSRAESPLYRKWLAERLLWFNNYRSAATRMIIPSLNLSFTERQQCETEQLIEIIPKGDTFILVDGNIAMREYLAGRYAFPFIEREGLYYGNPRDDEMAIRELERMRRSGASFIVFGNAAFWWFDHYSRFYNHLRSHSRCVLENERHVVFDLRP